MKKFEKIVVYDFKGTGFLANELKQYSKELVLITGEKDFSEEMKPESLDGADAFVAKPFGNYNKAFLEKASKLKYFGLASTGYSVVDTGYLKSRGITFTNVPGYSTESVAELVFSALLEIARRTSESMASAKKDYLAKRSLGWELKGKTIGIMGLGNIGSRIAEIASSFGMKVIYFSKTRKPKLEKKMGLVYLELEQLLEKADIISINCPFNEETKGILNKEKLELLKDGAVLLNSANAELCDLDAVAELAKAGKIYCWFDTLDKEEQRKKLFEIKNVIATPHIGWMTKEAQRRLDEITVQNVKMFLEGKKQNRVV